jgi:alanyl-tRNA synthetase
MAIDINEPEIKDAIKLAVEEATRPLLDKRDELLNEVKQLRKGKQVSPEDLEKLEHERDSYKEQLSKYEKDLKKANETVSNIQKQLESESSFTQKLLVDNGLTEALTKANVTNPAFLKAVKSTLASQVQLVTEGDARVAKVGEKSLVDFVNEWAKSEEGQYFVSAPANSGGGSNGGSNGGSSQTKGKIDGSLKERAEYFGSKFGLNETAN